MQACYSLAPARNSLIHARYYLLHSCYCRHAGPLQPCPCPLVAPWPTDQQLWRRGLQHQRVERHLPLQQLGGEGQCAAGGGVTRRGGLAEGQQHLVRQLQEGVRAAAAVAGGLGSGLQRQ